jgi:hypothetical protein
MVSQMTGTAVGPRTDVFTLNRISSNGTARRRVGIRGGTVANTVVSSSRASCCPTHWCGPGPMGAGPARRWPHRVAYGRY